MPVFVYKDGEYHCLAGQKIIQDGEAIELFPQNKISANGEWYYLDTFDDSSSSSSSSSIIEPPDTDDSSSSGGGGISEGYTGKVGFNVEFINVGTKTVRGYYVEEYRYSIGMYEWRDISKENMPKPDGKAGGFEIVWQEWFKEGLEIDCVYSFSKGKVCEIEDFDMWYQEIILGKKLYLADEEEESSSK